MSRPVIMMNRSSGTWWKCLLAFLGGIVFAIGALVGGGAIAASMVNTGTLLGPYAYVLTDEFQNKTILDIVTGVTTGEIQFNNLGDVARVTPEVEKIFDAINDSFEQAGIHMEIDFNDIKDEPWATIDIKLIDTFKNGVTLADVLKVNDSSEPILKYLSYPKDGEGNYDKEHPYTLAQYMDDSSFFTNLINNLKIGDVVTPDENNLLMKALMDFTISDLENKDKLYGLELGTFFSEEDKNNNALLKTIADNKWTINDLSDGNKLKSLKIGELVTPTEGTLMYAIKDKTVADLDKKDAFDDIEVGSIITVNSESSPIIKYLEHKTIAQLKDDDLINNMYISDIFTETDINNSKVLKALNSLPNPAHATDPSAPEYGCKVGDIGTRVNELKLKDVLDTSGGNKIVKALENERIDNLSKAIDKLNVGDVIEYHEKDPSDGKYYSDEGCTKELSPVLTKLIGNYPLAHPYPGQAAGGATITLDRSKYDHVQFNNGTEDSKTDFYKISDFLQKTEINITKQVVDEVVTWVATGSGTADPARDAYAESFDITVNFPAEWDNHYYYICNKPNKVNDMSTVVGDLMIKDVMNIEVGSAFDKPAIKYTSINDSGTLFDTIKTTLTLGDVITINESSSAILKTLKDTKLDAIGSRVDTLTFRDVVDHYPHTYPSKTFYKDDTMAEELPKLLTTFINKNSSVTDISGTINGLYVKDVVTYYETEPSDGKYYSDKACTEELPQILTSFIDKDVKINNMASAIGDLTIAEVLTDAQRSDRFLSNIPGTTKITAIGGAINDLKLTKVFEDQIYDGSGNLVSTWKYLLLESTESWIDGNPNKSTTPLSGKKCENYTVANLNQLITNMKENMTRASLNQLQRDGIVDLNNGKEWDDPTGFLAKTIPHPPFTPPAGKTKFGQLTMKEFADMISTYLP